MAGHDPLERIDDNTARAVELAERMDVNTARTVELVEHIDGNTARTVALAERIDGNTARTVELGDATLVILGEILSVLRTISEGLSDLRDLTESHSAALLQILDRLGPPNPGEAAP